MGILISRLFSFASKKRDCRILMLGLDAAGKSTILYKFKLGEVITSLPTIGFNMETVSYKNLAFHVWDIGGQTKIRELWSHYYSNMQGLIYVIDSTDLERIDLAKETLHNILNSSIRDVPLLVFANKQDQPGLSSKELGSRLGLETMRSLRWNIQGTCAFTGDGLYEGLDWLSKEISSDFGKNKH